MQVRLFKPQDVGQMCKIWNEVVEGGQAFPQTEMFNEETGAIFFGEQSATVIAQEDGRVFGLYILHPNNVGRCSHIANASYAVASTARGRGVGRLLVKDSLLRCRSLNFKGLQFNAVVESNTGARRLYESLGFTDRGVIPQGFALPDGSYEDTHIYFHDLS